MCDQFFKFLDAREKTKSVEKVKCKTNDIFVLMIQKCYMEELALLPEIKTIACAPVNVVYKVILK